MTTYQPIRSRGGVEHLLGVKWDKLCELAERAGGEYEAWDVLALSKNKWRHIDNPSPELKLLQRQIVKQVLSRYELPSDMFGAAPGRKLVEHARRHVRQTSVVTVDIRDFFPSTTAAQALCVFTKTLSLPFRIASPLTKLTTRHGHLPQGSPSSSYLAHLALLPVRNEIAELCQKLGVELTMYMDDIVFSGKRARALIEPTILALQHSGFRVSNRKTRVMGSRDTKEITGIDVTCDIIRARGTYVNELELELLGYLRKGSISAERHRSIVGKVRHVKQLCADQAAPLEEVLKALDVNDSLEPMAKKSDWKKCPGNDRCRATRQRRERARHGSS